MNPPTDEQGRHEAGPTENTLAAAKLAVGRLAADDSPSEPMARRARAARRLPPLGCGQRDPLVPADHQRWRDAWDIEMARSGTAPPWQRARASRLWSAGHR